MRLTLAAVALVAASGVALAQGTTTTTPTTPGTTAAPSSTTVPGTSPVTPPMASSMAPPAAPGSQTPGATMNTTTATTARNPSAVQTTNTAHRTAAAPVPGRNSFTMRQAAGRIAKAGYTKVTGLKKDNQGIWRGQADKDGNPVSVSLDYQGNVTGQ
jgi:hypothetical protein